MKKFLSNIIGLVIYEVFGIVGFSIAGLSILESLGYGFLFALILGCINEVRRDIWDLRKELKESKNESATETSENKVNKEPLYTQEDIISANKIMVQRRKQKDTNN